MNKFKNFFKSLGFQIVTTFIMGFLLIFLVYSAITLYQSRRIFIESVNEIDTVVFDTPPQNNAQPPIFVSKDDPPIVQRLQGRFLDNVLLTGAIVLVVAILVSLAVLELISEQFKQFAKGFSKIRESDYKVRLEKPGIYEYDILVDEFNDVVAELDRVEKLRKDLISDTTHELKTPVTAIKGNLEGIQDKVLKPTPERIKQMIAQIDKINELMDELSKYSKLRARLEEPKLEEVSLKSFIDKLAEGYNKQLSLNGIELLNNIPEDYKLMADVTLINKIFSNLIDNAIKYSEGTEIKISLEGNSILFADNGKGIAKEHLPNIFERFYRVEKSRNKKYGGLGLGLAIVKECVQILGWDIKAESEVGKGTSFRIRVMS